MKRKNIVKAVLVLCIALVMTLSVSALNTKTKPVNILPSNPAAMNQDIIFSDDFESYDDFVIDFPPWTNIDVDGAPTFGSSTNDWLNEGVPQAYIIFNPSMTTPPWTDPNIQPHSGAKFAGCFNDNNEGYISDDWLITPLLDPTNFDEVSFWAKSFNNQYNLERFEVGISTTDTDPASFTIISEPPYIVPPYESWTQYTFNLDTYDNQAIYIGIHMMSVDSWLFMVDDFSVTSTSDTTPPVTTCTITGTNPVTITLTATDDISGVDYTMYKLDDGNWMTYTAPVQVSEIGDHIVYFYSVDKAGNIEEEKSKTFNVPIPSNWMQQAKLIAPDGAYDDRFGWSVALDGDTALIGAWHDDNGKGSAYVFTRSGTTWNLQQKLTAADSESYNAFGISVALDGDTALIGAEADHDNGVCSGAAYIFVRSGTTWMQLQKLTADDGEAYDYFGVSVALHDEFALIGANYDDGKGSVYVFTYTGTSWTQETKLLAPDGESGDRFGTSVSLYDYNALIGADYDNGKGSAYFFYKCAPGWVNYERFYASDGAYGDYFGSSVSLGGTAGGTALIGAYANNGYRGAAYMYRSENLTTWIEEAKLIASDDNYDNRFGNSVSLYGYTALIGEFWDDHNGYFSSGSAYVFTRTDSTWIQQAEIIASDITDMEQFGTSVSLSGDTALIGAYGDGNYKGSAYVFIKENQPPIADFTWTPQDPKTNQQITFDASASYDPDGTITLYKWDWDNDGIYEDIDAIPTATHAFARPGDHPVTVCIKDDYGATSTMTKTVNVSEMNLIIEITGGLGITLKITNDGTLDANDIPWQIQVEGGILGRINKTMNGTVSLNTGESKTFLTGMLLGFGSLDISARVAGVEKTAKGTQIIIFSMVKK